MTAPSVPSREDVAAVLAEHIPHGYSCECGHELNSPLGWGRHLADAVLALYAPVVEQTGRDAQAPGNGPRSDAEVEPALGDVRDAERPANRTDGIHSDHMSAAPGDVSKEEGA